MVWGVVFVLWLSLNLGLDKLGGGSFGLQCGLSTEGRKFKLCAGQRRTSGSR